MSAFTNCAECGQRLHNSLFCSSCNQPTCCFDCLQKHVARHAPGCEGESSESGQVEKPEPPEGDVLLPLRVASQLP
jgi:hypothetical protein